MNGIGNDDRAHIPPAPAPPRAPWSAYVLHDITIGKSARNHTDHMNHAKSNHADGAVRRSSGCTQRYTVHVHSLHEDTISTPQLVDELLGRAGHIAEPLHAQFYLALQLSLAGPVLGQLRDHLQEPPCHPCHEVVPC